MRTEAMIRLVEILAWPVTTLFIAGFFRKVIAYLVFSVEEFNFFGARGRLKNVREMVREKANELMLSEKQEEERAKLPAKVRQDPEMTAAQLIELLIAAGVIPTDKAEAARSAVQTEYRVEV